MKEKEWIDTFVIPKLREDLTQYNPGLSVESAFKLAYSNEILSFKDREVLKQELNEFETDICIFETIMDTWKPRIIIEGKINAVTTHDAITYSYKANIHKNVYPYLRYGYILFNN